MLTRSLQSLLFKAGIYRPIYSVFERVCAPHRARERAAMLELYRSVVRPGDLVFDIGAHVGSRSDVFVKLGARVVAVEPNPECAWRIRARYPRVLVEEVAVGDQVGEAELFVCPKYTTTSSLSRAWLSQLSSQVAMFRHTSWDHVLKVPVTTLDRLIARHGLPNYIKIDVEGYDLNVLMGLSRAVSYVSFEFQPMAVDMGVECLDRLASLGYTLFNYTHLEQLTFRYAQWVSRDELLQSLRSDRGDHHESYGDVFAALSPELDANPSPP